MIVIEDVTQQKIATKSRDTFINRVTHELRTPLTNILMYAETAMEDGITDAGSIENSLNVINQEALRLNRIVSDMLSVAEIEAGTHEIKRDDLSLIPLIQQVANDHRAAAERKNIRLDLGLPPKMPVIQADRDKVALAVHNLVGNAIKYTPENGRIAIDVDCTDEQLSVTVSDSGIGIREDEIPRVFEQFYRAKDERVSAITGSGLGLSLARDVVRLHGGDITVESEINKGSRFAMTLPIRVRAA